MEETKSQLDANDRNQILIEKHEKLPSYCYWDCYSIEKETYQESYKWWNNIDTNQHKELKVKWVKFYKTKVLRDTQT